MRRGLSEQVEQNQSRANKYKVDAINQRTMRGFIN